MLQTKKPQIFKRALLTTSASRRLTKRGEKGQFYGGRGTWVLPQQSVNQSTAFSAVSTNHLCSVAPSLTTSSSSTSERSIFIVVLQVLRIPFTFLLCNYILRLFVSISVRLCSLPEATRPSDTRTSITARFRNSSPFRHDLYPSTSINHRNSDDCIILCDV